MKPPGSPGNLPSAQPTWIVGPPIVPESRLGALIEGEYRVARIIGQGELGITYEAHNPRLKRSFAILMLKRELAPTHEMMLAVRGDLRRAQELAAVGLMPIRQVTDKDGVPGFATELLDGESLRQRLGRGPLPLERALGLLLYLGHALLEAHRAGLVHGDLRPENVFLVRPGARSAYAGRAMLLEHSVRHLRRRPVGLDDTLPLGKLMYRTPEQVLGTASSADPSGDVFALGAILHECLTGRPAFFGTDVEAVLDNLSREPPPLAPNLSIGLSAALVEQLNVVIAGACATQLDARIPGAAGFVRALLQIVAGAGLTLPEVVTEAPPAGVPPGRISRIFRRLSGAFSPINPRPVTPPPAAARPERPPQLPRRGTVSMAPREILGGSPPAPTDAAAAPELPEGGTSVGVADPPALPAAAAADLVEQATQPPRQRPAVNLDATSELPPSDQRATVALARVSVGTPLSERATRQLRARDITQLVIAVQQGQLDPSRAMQLAREPEDIPLGESDLLRVDPPGDSASFPLAPSLQMSAPAPSALRRLLLRHQEIIAMLVGAAVMLGGGLLFLWCRG